MPTTQPQLHVLSFPEHLLVWTWRKLVSGRGGCPLVGREYAAFDGGEEMLVALAAFLRALGQGSRRALSVGPPGCLGMTADERQMLALLAAGQCEDETLIAAHLDWLVRPESRDGVAAAVRCLARTLTANDLDLPRPAIAAMSAAPMLAVVN